MKTKADVERLLHDIAVRNVIVSPDIKRLAELCIELFAQVNSLTLGIRPPRDTP